MKKIITGLSILLFCTTTCAYSEVFTAPLPSNTGGYNLNIQRNISKDSYLKFYQIDSKNIKASFLNRSKDSEKEYLKTLSNDDKKNYKYVKKIQKLILQNRWEEVFYKYPDFFPAYIQYYDYYHSKKDFKRALPVLEKINNMNKKYQVLEQSSLDYNLGVLHFYNMQYSQALNYFRKFEPTTDDTIISAIADCYYYTGNYNASLAYLNKLTRVDYHNKETFFGVYYALNNYYEAVKYARELLKENWCYPNLMRVVQTTSKEEEKLSYAYKARTLAGSDNEFMEANRIIADLEQKKLDKKAANLTGFVKIPKWSQFAKQIPESTVPAEIAAKQDEFFKTANEYLTKYSGTQLANAFTSLNQDLTNYIQIKQNEYYQQQQLEAQKALLIEQQRNNMLQQQMIYEQRMHNYLEQQTFYYMSRPYYYMHPRYFW